MGRCRGERKESGGRKEKGRGKLGRQAGQADQAVREKEKGGEVRLGHRVGQARKGRKRKAGPDPRVGLKRKKGKFFQNKSFSISNFQN